MTARRSKTLASQKKEIVAALANQVRRNPEAALEEEIEQVEDALEGFYERTTAYWEGHSDSGRGPSHPEPHPEFTWSHWDVDDDLTISVRVYSQMVEPGGGKSKLWYWISRGTDFVMPVKSAPFPLRMGRRTDTGTLDPGPQRGYKTPPGEGMVLPEGYRVVRSGTGWDHLIGKEFKAAMSGKLEAKIRFRTEGRKTI